VFGLARWSVLLTAAAITAPALWAAFVTHEATPDTALLRFLIAVPVAGVMLGILRMVTASYGRHDRRAAIRAVAERLDAARGDPNRRATDRVR
jgi:hypothetical protein